VRQVKRASSAVGYGFTAWLMAALVVYAAPPMRYSAIALVFWFVFRLYYETDEPLHPAAAGAITIAFVAAMDLALVAPYYLHPMDLFKSFWDWQLPALIVVAAIAAAGRRRRDAEQPVRVLQNR
jgi:hypothetical protein